MSKSQVNFNKFFSQIIKGSRLRKSKSIFTKAFFNEDLVVIERRVQSISTCRTSSERFLIYINLKSKSISFESVDGCTKSETVVDCTREEFETVINYFIERGLM